VTIPKTAQHSQDAALFIKYLLETNGQNVMSNAGQIPVFPAYVDNASNVPQTLSKDITSSGPQP
jgi:ABC-type Fe3+ transport system substrate-binding protein